MYFGKIMYAYKFVKMVDMDKLLTLHAICVMVVVRHVQDLLYLNVIHVIHIMVQYIIKIENQLLVIQLAQSVNT
jgi:hypothetical protein